MTIRPNFYVGGSKVVGMHSKRTSRLLCDIKIKIGTFKSYVSFVMDKNVGQICQFLEIMSPMSTCFGLYAQIE